ncbi:21227_t:CDS:1, partial [Entrophospora sp. SA101]
STLPTACIDNKNFVPTFLLSLELTRPILAHPDVTILPENFAQAPYIPNIIFPPNEGPFISTLAIKIDLIIGVPKFTKRRDMDETKDKAAAVIFAYLAGTIPKE